MKFEDIPDEVVVQGFDHKTWSLKKTQLEKSLKFLEYGCIRLMGDGEYLMLPLNKADSFEDGSVYQRKKPYPINYNSTGYNLFLVGGFWTCNCQGYVTKKKKGEIPFCSHVQALRIFLHQDKESKLVEYLRRKQVFVRKETIMRELDMKRDMVSKLLTSLKKRKVVVLYKKKYWGLKL